ncbi:MAG: OsmC family protein [Halodesulfurarchaeum sp.]
MPDTVDAVSKAGYSTRNSIGEHEIQVDSREEDGPNPTATLLAAYASCFVVGLRIAARDRGQSGLGTIEISVTGHRDANRNLEDIEFEVSIETEMSRADRSAIVDRAIESCHVGNALSDSLSPSISFPD